MPCQPGQCLLPALADLDRALRSIQAAATRTLGSLLPWRVNNADEIHPCIGTVRQCDRDLTRADIAVRHSLRLLGHAPAASRLAVRRSGTVISDPSMSYCPAIPGQPANARTRCP